jgi:hypothetical protein
MSDTLAVEELERARDFLLRPRPKQRDYLVTNSEDAASMFRHAFPYTITILNGKVYHDPDNARES